MHADQPAINAYWTARSNYYHARQIAGERAIAERQLWQEAWRAALPSSAHKVLDVGTGSGYIATLLADLGCDVTGIDLSEGMLEQARKHHEQRAQEGLSVARFVRYDALAPSSVSGPFDAVVSRYLMWTLPEPVQAIQAWVKISRPGGVIICADAPWFPDGIAADTAVESDAGKDSFTSTYCPEVLRNLELAQARSSQEYSEVFQRAGLQDIDVQQLPEIAELDHRFGTLPGEECRPRFLISGVVPS